MNPVYLVSVLLIPCTALAASRFAGALSRRSIGQQVRELGPSTHLRKAGTPTMGGLIALGLWMVATALLVPRGSWPAQGFVLAATGLFALIGAADDLLSLRRRRSEGLTGWQKLGLSIVASLCLGFAFPEALSVAQRIPFTDLRITLPPTIHFCLICLIFLAATNSVNLTDGLDGLATGASLITTIGLLVLAGTVEAGTLLLPLIGVLIGFLWVNAYPATLFLGDVGSFGLGGLLAAAALANGLAFFLPLLAGVMVLETLSVMIQVSWFRLRGRRVFKMAPLHHHCEVSDRRSVSPIIRSPEWPEQKVTIRFWIVQALCVGLAILAAR